MGGMPTGPGLPPLSTADAVAASVACARAVGLPVDHPEVIAEGYSVRVRLHPTPVVSRVVTLGSELRGHPRPWLEREVAVGRFLSGSPVDVVAPWDAPGPYVVDGVDVSLWSWVEHGPGTVSGTDFGTMLGDLHAALASYDADLPPLVGPLTDIATALTARRPRPAPGRRAARAPGPGLAAPPVARGRPHRQRAYDRHRSAVDRLRGRLRRAGRVGPRLDDGDRRGAPAYPGHVDATRLEDCRDLRRLQILASLLVGDLDEAPLYDELVARLQRRL